MNLPWGYVRSHTKFGLYRFGRFVVGLQTNGQTDTNKQSISIDSINSEQSSLKPHPLWQSLYQSNSNKVPFVK